MHNRFCPMINDEDYERAMDGAMMDNTVSDYERSLPMADFDVPERPKPKPDAA